MNKLSELLRERGVNLRQMAEALKTADPRIDRPAVSRYCRHQNLPTREQLALICQILGCDPDEIYAKEDLDLLHCYKSGLSAEKKSPPEQVDYKLTVRLPKGRCNGLNVKLATCGYPSQRAWLEKCLDELEKEYKKIAPTVGAAETKPKEKTTLRVSEKGGDVNAF